MTTYNLEMYQDYDGGAESDSSKRFAQAIIADSEDEAVEKAREIVDGKFREARLDTDRPLCDGLRAYLHRPLLKKFEFAPAQSGRPATEPKKAQMVES